MKQKNLIVVILSALFLVLVIGLVFAFDNSKLTANSLVFTMYLVAKILFGLLFICVIIWSVIRKRFLGTAYPVIFTAAALQGIAPLMRISLAFSAFQFGYNLILLIVGLFVFVIMFGMSSFVSKKQVKSEKKYEGKEIEVNEDLPDKF